MKTYTPHKLTGHMLKRLSQLMNNRKPNYGVSMRALVLRGLVDCCESKTLGGSYLSTYTITEAGKRAFLDARSEGW